MNYELRIKKQKESGFTRTPKFGVTPKGGGFTLVETLVAISILTMSILGFMSVLASGISGANYAKNKIIAGYLAQEGIEYLRNMRDNYVLYDTTSTQQGWNNFKSELSSCNSSDVNNGACGINSLVLSTNPSFVFPCAGSCKLYINNGSYSNNSSGTDSGFVRKIWKNTVSADEVKIYSEVDWKQGATVYSAIFAEDLFNWVE